MLIKSNEAQISGNDQNNQQYDISMSKGSICSSNKEMGTFPDYTVKSLNSRQTQTLNLTKDHAAARNDENMTQGLPENRISSESNKTNMSMKAFADRTS